MPRACTICTNAERHAIDLALAGGDPIVQICAVFRVSRDSLTRHAANHLPKLLEQGQEARRIAEQNAEALAERAEQQAASEQTHAIDVQTEIRRCFERVNLLFDACDRWLRDADDPTRYDLGPRASDVLVTYLVVEEGMAPVRKKAPLSTLLGMLEANGTPVERWETRFADPRELILKTAAQLRGQTELLAKLLGELDERPTVNLLTSPDWLMLRQQLLSVLVPYPDARAALAEALIDAG